MTTFPRHRSLAPSGTQLHLGMDAARISNPGDPVSLYPHCSIPDNPQTGFFSHGRRKRQKFGGISDDKVDGYRVSRVHWVYRVIAFIVLSGSLGYWVSRVIVIIVLKPNKLYQRFIGLIGFIALLRSLC